jgi:ribonuclease E
MSGNGNALSADQTNGEETFAEPSIEQPEFDVTVQSPSALVNEPLVETVALTPRSEPVHEGLAVTNITAVRVPPTVTAPTMIALPVVQQAPLPIDELQPVLQSAGLMLVQTAPERHAEAQQKMASEPRPPRPRRERPQLPPVDDAPLVQVETQHTSHERASA